MTKLQRIEHRFVRSVPDVPEPGVLYISMEFATAIHLCACGCGQEVVTPFTPRDWNMKFDGESVSLSPSIGNWGFACRSHYWIRHDKVVWVPEWDDFVPWWRRWHLWRPYRHVSGANDRTHGPTGSGLEVTPRRRERKIP